MTSLPEQGGGLSSQKKCDLDHIIQPTFMLIYQSSMQRGWLFGR